MAVEIGNVWNVQAWADGVWAAGVWAGDNPGGGPSPTPSPGVVTNQVVEPTDCNPDQVGAQVVVATAVKA